MHHKALKRWNFAIADTFTDSLARLTGDEQKAVKNDRVRFANEPASPGLSFHKLDKAKDKNFWSVRVNVDIRLIVHKSESSLLLAMSTTTTRLMTGRSGANWRLIPNRRRSVGRDSKTVKEIVVPVYVQTELAVAI